MSAACCGHRGNEPQTQMNTAYRRVLWGFWRSMLRRGDRCRSACGLGIAPGRRARFPGRCGELRNQSLRRGHVSALSRRRSARQGRHDGVFGLWILAVAVWHLYSGARPEAVTMGAVGIAALAANAVSFGLLWAYRGGDANMRSAWICTRNDVLGNLAVLLAAVGVFGTGTGWPDVVVAVVMAGLAIQGAWLVVRHAVSELTLGNSRHAPVGG
jgi:hypothetical protein